MTEFFWKISGLPDLASVHGKDVDMLIAYIHWLMLALFIGWLVYFGYALWRFRKSKNPKADYVGTTTHASSYIEVGVAVAELVLLFALAVPMWAKSVDKFPDEKASTVIRIIGQQFYWTARYPGADGVFGKADLKYVTAENPMGLAAKDPKLKDGDPAGKDDIVTGPDEMAVPVGTPVIAHVSSLDVIHSFKVVPLRVTQDANPGMSIPIHFVPTKTNTYFIQCSQLCGVGHYQMKGIFKVLAPQDYDTWIKAKAAAAAKPAVSYE
jgi:cytochrome c oxidase subunit 2